MEELKYLESYKQFIKPNIQDEIGEIVRVASTYQPDDQKGLVELFINKALETELIDLTEEDWRNLENTDSYEIKTGDWNKVDEHTIYYNQTTGSERDWRSIRSKMETGLDLDAPIILKHKGSLHLVSGNTRLMVARALGVTPRVLIVEI